MYTIFLLLFSLILYYVLAIKLHRALIFQKSINKININYSLKEYIEDIFYKYPLFLLYNKYKITLKLLAKNK